MNWRRQATFIVVGDRSLNRSGRFWLVEKGIEKNGEFPLWRSGLVIQLVFCGVGGLVPGLVPWVKDPVLPSLEHRSRLDSSSGLIPGLGPSLCQGCGWKRRKKKKKMKGWKLKEQCSDYPRVWGRTWSVIRFLLEGSLGSDTHFRYICPAEYVGAGYQIHRCSRALYIFLCTLNRV